jgi:hyaluronoglucosaminidase
VLSRIPALTLVEGYARGEAYEYGAAFRRAAREVLGDELAASVEGALLSLQDTGLDGMDAERRQRLRTRFAGFDHPAAREIVGWLDGAYAIGAEELQTQ